MGFDIYKVIEWAEAPAQRAAPFAAPHKVEQAGRLGRVVPLRRLFVEAVPAKRKVGIHMCVVSGWWVIAPLAVLSVLTYNSRRWASESFGAGAVAARTRWTQAAKRVGRSWSWSWSCCDGSSAMVGLVVGPVAVYMWGVGRVVRLLFVVPCRRRLGRLRITDREGGALIESISGVCGGASSLHRVIVSMCI